MACEEFFLKKLQERNFRLTPQRKAMLSVLHEMAGFTTAEEIYTRAQHLRPSVHISTVYRTLELLQEFRLVACLDSGNGQRHYKLLDVEVPHLHLLCRQCGRVIGMAWEYFEPFTSIAAEEYGFSIDAEQLYLTGLCRDCRAAAG